MLYVSLILYILMVISLIVTRVYNKDKLSLFVKTVLSIILITSVVVISSSQRWIMISIMFSSIADIFLGIHRIEKGSSYLFYMVLFLVVCSQVCILISSIHLTRFNYYSIILAIIMNFTLYFSFAKACKMGKMQNLSMIYSFIFLLIVDNVLLNIHQLDSIYIAAIILYFVSDIVLFIQKFISKSSKTVLDGINKLMYYTAQILFVLYILK